LNNNRSRYGFCLLNDATIATQLVNTLEQRTFRPSLLNLELATSTLTTFVSYAVKSSVEAISRLLDRSTVRTATLFEKNDLIKQVRDLPAAPAPHPTGPRGFTEQRPSRLDALHL